jgi:hypothetical protein
MPDRSQETTVTFAHPFMLASFDAEQRAGTYRLMIEEEEILGLSFPAYRRTSMVIVVPANMNSSGRQGSFPVDPKELDAALEVDARASRRVPSGVE